MFMWALKNVIYFEYGFIPYEAEQPLEKKNIIGKQIKKSPFYRWVKLVISRIIELFRFKVEGKLPAGEQFQGFALRGKKLLDILMTSSNGDNNYAIFQNRKKTFRDIKKKEPIQPILINIL